MQLVVGEAGAPWCNGQVKLPPLGIDGNDDNTDDNPDDNTVRLSTTTFGRDVGAG
jgi:hypothetical protein